MIVRIGGDEFMVFIKNCTKETAFERVEMIRKSMAEEIEAYDFNFSYGSCSLKDGVSKAFSKSDELLYEMKKEKREDNCQIIIDGKGD